MFPRPVEFGRVTPSGTVPGVARESEDLRPAGPLATFSCSGGVSPELFQKIVAGAAADAAAARRLRGRSRAGAQPPAPEESGVPGQQAGAPVAPR